MGARKGQNNFASHQAAKVDKNLSVLQLVLKTLGRGHRFADERALVRYVAERTGLHPTTIRRNRRYMREIAGHLSKNPIAIVRAADETRERATQAVARLDYGIEIARLNREITRLKRALELAADRRLETTALAAPKVSDGEDEWRRAFEDTAAVLMVLLNHLTNKELGITLDLSAGTIRDETEEGDKAEIARPPRTRRFVDWVSRRRGIETLLEATTFHPALPSPSED